MQQHISLSVFGDNPIFPLGDKKEESLDLQGFLDGSGDRIRTNDTSGMNRMLWPTELRRQMVAGAGLEPATSGL